MKYSQSIESQDPVSGMHLESRKLVRFAAIALAVLFGLGTPVQGQGNASAEILQLINTGQFEEARTRARAQNPSPTEAAFIEGRILKVEGRYTEAIAEFRQSLLLDPANLAARRELAHTLLLDQQYTVAKFHFEALLDSDPNLAMHDGYRQFLRAIELNKPFGVSGHFALIPSSNINRGTTNTVFDTDSGTFVIDPDSKADSGVGLQLGVSAFARFLPDAQSSVVLNTSVVGTVYKDDIHNSATATIGLTYGHTFEDGRWSVGPYASYGWREDDSDLNIIGLRAAVDYRTSSRMSLGVRAKHEYRSYQTQSYNSGPFDQASIIVAYQVDPTFIARATLTAEFSRPNARHSQYDGVSLGASLSKSWEGGLATSLSLEGGQRAYLGVYPLTSVRRSDDFVTLSMSVQNTRINLNGLTPRLTCSLTANRSNVAFYDYDTQECQATLSMDF